MMKCKLHKGKYAAFSVQRIPFLLTKLEQLLAKLITQTQEEEELASVTLNAGAQGNLNTVITSFRCKN